MGATPLRMLNSTLLFTKGQFHNSTCGANVNCTHSAKWSHLLRIGVMCWDWSRPLAWQREELSASHSLYTLHRRALYWHQYNGRYSCWNTWIPWPHLITSRIVCYCKQVTYICFFSTRCACKTSATIMIKPNFSDTLIILEYKSHITYLKRWVHP